MTRNLKALGLALIAVFAMSALAVSSASAATGNFTLEEAGTLTGDQLGANHFFETGSGLTLTCTSSHFDGVGTQPASSNTATIKPTYSGCTTKVSIFTFPATIDFTSCDYTFYGTESDVAIGCESEGDTIDIKIYQNHTNHTAGTTLCELKVPAQTINNEGAVTYTNTSGSPKDIDVTASKAEFSMTRTGSSLCGAENQTGKYTGNATVTAFDEEGTRIGGEVG